MSIRKCWFIVVTILFLLSFTSCNNDKDGDIVLNRPTGLACSIPTYDDGAIIRWNAVESAIGYRVFIDNQEIGMTNSNWFHFRYEDSELYCGKTCSVQAYNEKGGVSLMSNALIIPNKAPISVQEVKFYFTVTKKVDNSMLIEWQDVSAIKYEVYIDEEKIDETTELSFILSADKVFDYNGRNISIHVVEEDVKVAFIPTEYVIVAPVIITAPVITSTNDEEGNFVIKWKEVEGASSYNIYIDGAQYAYNVTELEYAFIDCPDYTGKNVSVRAVDIYGRTSVFSNDCLYKNTLQKPQIEVSFLETGDVNVSWHKIKYATKYNIYFKNQLISDEYTKVETITNSYTYSKASLQNAEMYEIYVEAVDDYGNLSEASDYYRWQIELGTPNIYTCYERTYYTVVLWEEVANAVQYEVYINDRLYKIVDTIYCEISNSFLSQYIDKVVTVVAVSKQGLKGDTSLEYDLTK